MEYSLSSILKSWLPQLNRQVWILAAGRLLSQTGNGFTLFYFTIFFVNQVGLSATAVGIGLGSGSLCGVAGRFLSGYLADAIWGRKRTLLLSAAVSAVASFVLALADNLPLFILANLLMGIGVGLYWPAAEAVVTDLTPDEQRNEAFATSRLADSLGLGIGVLLGGVLISTTGNYRALFVIDGILAAIFFVVVHALIAETLKFEEHQPQPVITGWLLALSDRQLMVYVAVNVLFTTYLAQVETTMPLYFTNFVSGETLPDGFSPATISSLFTWYVVFAALCQLPVVRALASWSRAQALSISMWIWGLGFILVWATGVTAVGHQALAILALSTLALASAVYKPFASAFVAEIAPESLRGVYLSINSQCWGIGHFVGPLLGNWALEKSPAISKAMPFGLLADDLWLAAAISTIVGITILQYLDWMHVGKETFPIRSLLSRLRERP